MEEFDHDKEMAFAKNISREVKKITDFAPELESALDDTNNLGSEVLTSLREVRRTASPYADRYFDSLKVEPGSVEDSDSRPLSP